MSRFLLVTNDFMGTSLAWKLLLEGHEVAAWSRKPEGKEHLKGMVNQFEEIRDAVAWCGRSGYFIADDEQDMTKYRQMGMRCYGGNEWTAKLENDRVMQMKVAEQCGVPVSKWHAVKSVDEAVAFIKKHPEQWVLKQIEHAPKTWSFVGKSEDGSDTIDQLEWFKTQPEYKKLGSVPFMLQEIVDGIEFGVSAWWMGSDWKRRDDGSVIVELNKEHKKELDGDIGRTCGEMGTVSRLTDASKLFEEMLGPLTSLLLQWCQDVVINIDANCGIFLENGEPKAYLYEWTPRQGYPASSLQEYLLNTECGQFFADLIDRRQGNVEHKEEWGVVTVLATGEFPSERESHEGSFKDQPVIIPQCVGGWSEHIAPFYIRWDDKKEFWRVADYYEYVLGVCHHDNDILKANERCVEDMKLVEIRAPRYRHDIGQKFANEELDILNKWGYLN